MNTCCLRCVTNPAGISSRDKRLPSLPICLQAMRVDPEPPDVLYFALAGQVPR
ncbi:hypothetical protein FD39_GL000630 [Lactobacillus amylolyticus DSM 11664]|nr:hypothetical protein FD39_GL000630 [Lactobacillus amylolyticus DSM 11664]